MREKIRKRIKELDALIKEAIKAEDKQSLAIYAIRKEEAEYILKSLR